MGFLVQEIVMDFIDTASEGQKSREECEGYPENGTRGKSKRSTGPMVLLPNSSPSSLKIPERHRRRRQKFHMPLAVSCCAES